MSAVNVLHGDCLELMRTLPDRSIDAVVTDPPYGLAKITRKMTEAAVTQWVSGNRAFIPDGRGFGGASWDRFVPPPAVWDECLRVLKPGGFLLSFAGTRTQDLMGLSLRLAGFEVRDEIGWCYVQSFPKTMNLELAAQKQGLDRPAYGTLGTALKPAHEPILVCQKPVEGTVVGNLEAWGTGALSIDEARIPTSDKLGGGSMSEGKQMSGAWKRPWMDSDDGRAAARARTARSVAKAEELGRYPANLIFDEPSGALLDQEAGRPISKMFFAAKPEKSEKPYVEGRTHETVKPLALMEYLVKLVTPAGGTVLDPFAGSGTTAEAALRTGRNGVVCEREEDFLPLIKQRIARATKQGSVAA
ncbi:DNA-methyltransferase [Leucobacter sp. HY1910]